MPYALLSGCEFRLDARPYPAQAQTSGECFDVFVIWSDDKCTGDISPSARNLPFLEVCKGEIIQSQRIIVLELESLAAAADTVIEVIHHEETDSQIVQCVWIFRSQFHHSIPDCVCRSALPDIQQKLPK